MKVEWTSAGLSGVNVDLPRLAQRVGLHEMAFVVHMKSVLHCVILEVRHCRGEVNCHKDSLLRGSRFHPSPRVHRS